MSVTLVLVPVSLGSNLVAALITSIAASAALTAQNYAEENNMTRDFEYEMNKTLSSAEMLVANAMNKQYEKQYQTFCSQYKTIFTDENLLIKTLSEHGIEDIVNQDGKLYGTAGDIKLEFEKGKDGIYDMLITHKENEDMSIVDELSDEYKLNVQEQSYMNIKQNLEKQNLSIESEEVMEDNSIMITVNLE